MKGLTMKNWLTTLVGALGGGFIAIQPLVASGTVDWTAVITGFIVAALGAVSKDFNKTGV